jgi:hypothetical protein
MYMPQFKRDRRADKTTGVELTYDYVVHRLQEVDFADAVNRLGFLPVHAEGADSGAAAVDIMEIDFLGVRYRLSKNGGVFSVDAVDGRETGLEVRSILCYYALSPAQVEPLFDFCLLDNFSNGVFASTRAGPAGDKSKQGWDGRQKDALETALAGLSPEEEAACFAKAAQKLGMTPVSAQNGQKWDYRLLPKMPVQVVFYESDDEFPPALRVYFDKTAIMVFDFEPLAVLNGCLVRTIIGCLGQN